MQTGDRVALSVSLREPLLRVSDEKLARRAQDNPVVMPSAERGNRKPYLKSVLQADDGLDFDSLREVAPKG